MQLDWTECADLPVPFSSPNIVQIGEDLYIGGGVPQANVSMNRCVFHYRIKSNTWTPLPPCETLNHSLTALNSQLLAIGGHISGVAVNTVCTFTDGGWKEILPSMPTPRWNLSAISYDNKAIIASGGTLFEKSNGETERTAVVEVYIHDKNNWYKTNPLPFPEVQFMPIIISNTCYILGGTCQAAQANIVLYCNVSSLLANIETEKTTPQT